MSGWMDDWIDNDDDEDDGDDDYQGDENDNNHDIDYPPHDHDRSNHDGDIVTMEFRYSMQRLSDSVMNPHKHGSIERRNSNVTIM